MPLSLTRSQVRNIDAQAIANYRLPGIVLMENAGRGAAQVLVGLGVRGTVVICAGKGNNGGDGFVMARHLELCNIETSVCLFCDPHELSPDAATNYHVHTVANQRLDVLGKTPQASNVAQRLSAADWIVDALLGTGTQGSIREPYLTAIAAINCSGKKVFSVDLPSGMDCDTGQPLGTCVRADHTATFVARKAGFDVPGAAELTGRVHVVDIGVPKRLLASIWVHRSCP